MIVLTFKHWQHLLVFIIFKLLFILPLRIEAVIDFLFIIFLSKKSVKALVICTVRQTYL